MRSRLAPTLAAFGLAAFIVVGCSSSDDATPAGTSADETTAAAATSTAATEPAATDPSATEPAVVETTVATEPPATEPPATEPPATEPADPGPTPAACDALTAAAFTEATGIAVTARGEEFRGVCSYDLASGETVATLLVGDAKGMRAAVDSIRNIDSPGMKFTVLDGVGDLAVVAGAPGPRGLLVATWGYDLLPGTAQPPLNAEQLGAILRAIVANER